MASCRECSNQISDNDRFCAQCGSLLADDIEVLSTEKAVTTAHVARQGPSPVALVVVAGVLVMASMFWVLSRSSDDASGDGDETADRAGTVVGDEIDDERYEGDTEETQDPLGGNDGADNGTDDETGRTDTTDTSDDDQGAAEEHALAIDEPGPVLGEEVGLSLWIGGTSNLSRIDLDTAETQRFDVTNRRPVLISGEWLVLSDSNGDDGLFAVPLDNPDADEVRLGSGFYWDQFLHPSRDNPDRVWILGEGGVRPTWQSVRLSDGEIVEEVPASIGTFTGLAGGPDLGSAPDGGIYERRGGDFVRVADGALAGVSDTRVLVRTCTTPASCTVHWRDRSTWERLDGPEIPTGVLTGTFPSWLSAGGRILFAFSDDGEHVYDLERGIALPLSGQHIWALRPGSVSGNERLIAAVNVQTPEIHDLDTGEVYRLDGLSFRGDVGTLFAEND